jgi:hypothetical protein
MGTDGPTNGPTDRPTDQWTDTVSYRGATSRLKNDDYNEIDGSDIFYVGGMEFRSQSSQTPEGSATDFSNFLQDLILNLILS